LIVGIPFERIAKARAVPLGWCGPKSFYLSEFISKYGRNEKNESGFKYYTIETHMVVKYNFVF
jgi:hypothetical protein